MGYHIFAMMENCYQRRMFWMLSIGSLGFIRDIWRGDTISIRLVIMMEYWGKCYYGRPCDNEPEAICETYELEQRVSSTDRIYLFNPINFHRNHRYLLEKYVRDEITELGLQRDILADLAFNPFLILRYNLVDLCRKYCIYISAEEILISWMKTECRL